MLPFQASIQFKGWWLLFVHKHSFIILTAEVLAASSGKMHVYQGTQEQHDHTALQPESHYNSLCSAYITMQLV